MVLQIRTRRMKQKVAAAGGEAPAEVELNGPPLRGSAERYERKQVRPPTPALVHPNRAV